VFSATLFHRNLRSIGVSCSNYNTGSALVIERRHGLKDDVLAANVRIRIYRIRVCSRMKSERCDCGLKSDDGYVGTGSDAGVYGC